MSVVGPSAACGGPGGKRRLVLGVVGGVLLLDLSSKAWIQARFLLGDSVPLAGDWIRFTYVLNPGAAFGLHVGPWSRPVFAALAFAAAVVISALIRGTPATDRPRLLALALLLGGAAGNLVDRLRAHGAVVDFLDVGVGALRWPVFNLADVAVSVGALLLVSMVWREDAGAPGAVEVAVPAEEAESAGGRS